MDRTMILATAFAAIWVAGSTPATAYCNIKGLDCWGSGTKCNIKFRNKTGEGSGVDKHQKSEAVTVVIQAMKDAGERAGSHKITLLAGQNHTMNLDNKVDSGGFQFIEMHTPKDFKTLNAPTMKCPDIQKILNQDGSCNLFVYKHPGGGTSVEYKCAGGKVTSYDADAYGG